MLQMHLWPCIIGKEFFGYLGKVRFISAWIARPMERGCHKNENSLVHSENVWKIQKFRQIQNPLASKVRHLQSQAALLDCQEIVWWGFQTFRLSKYKITWILSYFPSHLFIIEFHKSSSEVVFWIQTYRLQRMQNFEHI